MVTTTKVAQEFQEFSAEHQHVGLMKERWNLIEFSTSNKKRKFSVVK
jgi:hypothetical protein